MKEWFDNFEPLREIEGSGSHEEEVVMFRSVIRFTAFVLLLCSTVGFAPIKQERDSEECKPSDMIAIGKTTRRQIVEECGLPLNTRYAGNFVIYEYHDKSEQVGKGIGLSVLGGLAGGIPLHLLAGNYNKESIYYMDISSGVVQDFCYHDYKDRKGHDASESLVLQAASEIDCGKVDEGIGMLKQAISLNPKNHRAYNTLAWILAELDVDAKMSLTYALTAVKLFPESPYNNGTLGLAYLKNNDQEKARRYLQLALKQFEMYAPHDQKAINHDTAYLTHLLSTGK
ncbi:MAG: hypothetical protein HXX11_03185 [Desulfuromonadales bacterium]|nr:hypothetical protein [Desulfuromonadales bacterium]